MKKIGFVITLAFIFNYSQMNAQTTEVSTQTPEAKVQEFGIGLSNFKSFSLQYLWGNDNRLFRLSGNIGLSNINETSTSRSMYVDSTYLSSSSNNLTQNNPINLNLGLSLGIIKTKGTFPC